MTQEYFLHIKEEEPNIWGEAVMKNVWITWSSLLYLNLKSFLDPKPSSFPTFQCILHHSGVFFPRVLKFLEIKEGGPNFCGEPIMQNIRII